MNVLYVYNYYQNPGGEDNVFAAEPALLEQGGHTVHRYTLHNDAIKGMNRLVLAKQILWNRDAHEDIRRIVRENGIDLVHFHNTFPLISPSAYYAAKKEGARVVHTLHNFRMICPNSLLFRDGHICEDCLGKSLPWPGTLHSCYHDSLVQSAAISAMLASHGLMGTWTRQIDLYIALSDFARGKFIEGGLPAGKIVVKPNFIDPDPGMGSGTGGYALFAGRLAASKGIDTMLRAWETLGAQLPLKIVGDGPMAALVKDGAASRAGIEYLGLQPRARVLSLMKEATVLMFPSLWYEGFPMTIVEAYAIGLPVIASDLGSMSSIVKDHVTGLLFQPGNVPDMISKVQWICGHPEQLQNFRGNARLEYTSRYTAATNYMQLMGIYGQALGNAVGVGTPAAQEQYGA